MENIFRNQSSMQVIGFKSLIEEGKNFRKFKEIDIARKAILGDSFDLCFGYNGTPKRVM
jgi:hypothetical protein